jgi:hypothetical protein
MKFMEKGTVLVQNWSMVDWRVVGAVGDGVEEGQQQLAGS